MADAARLGGDLSEPPMGSPIPFPLILIALLGVGLRVAHVLWGEASPYAQNPIMDEAYHLDWARALGTGTNFSSDAYFRAPLYPGFLGLLHQLMGENLQAWRLLQCCLGGVTILLTGLLGLRVFGRPQALLAALIMAVAWVPLHFDTLLLIPVLFLPLVLGALLGTLGLESRPSGRRALVAGLLWGLATITRPNVLLLAPLLFFWVRGRRRARAGWMLALIFTAGWLMPVAPVSLRNRIVGQEWTLVATQAGVNLWIGNNPDSDGVSAIVPGTRAGWWEGHQDAQAQAELAAGRALNPGEVSGHFVGRTWDWLKENPTAFVQHLLHKTRLFLCTRELGNNLEPGFFASHYDPLVRVWLIPFGALLGFALVGACLARGLIRSHGPLFAFVPIYALGVIAFFVCSRFRLPVWPVMAVFAAQGGVFFWRAVRTRDHLAATKILLPALGIWALSIMITPSNLFTSESVGEMQLGDAAMAAGHHARAAEHYARATAQKRVSPHARLGLAQALVALKQLDRAQPILDGLLEGGGFPEAREARLRLEVSAGRYSHALDLGADYARAFPQEPGVVFQLGRASYGLKDFLGARDRFQRVLELDPRHGGAAFSRARCLDALKVDSLAAWVLAADLYDSLRSVDSFAPQAIKRAMEIAQERGKDQLEQRLSLQLVRWNQRHGKN